MSRKIIGVTVGTPISPESLRQKMKISQTIEEALAEAKASGEFDGEDGYTPEKGVDYFDGKDGYTPVKGKDYFDGKDGTSATHSWNGTALTVTSASGTSSADLKGEKGDAGAQGYSFVTSVSRPSFTEAQWETYGEIGRSENWSNSSSVRNGCRVGDIFTVVGTATDTKNAHVAYFRCETASGDMRGTCIAHSIAERGATGAAGTTPVKGTDYFTEADKEEFLSDMDAVRYTEQTLTNEQQTQTLKNIGAVSKAEMFTVRQSVTPDYTNQVPLSVDENGDIYNGCGYIADKHMNSTGALEDNTGTYVTGFIPVKLGDVIRIKDPGRTNINTTLMYTLYGTDKAPSSGIGRSVSQIQNNANQDLGVLTIDGNVVTWTLNPINYYMWRNFAWMRISAHSSDVVVTINEPLTESVKEQLILSPNVKLTEDNIELDVSEKPLAGKTVVGFGDSIFGYVRDATSVLSVVAVETGAIVHNVGFGGCRMAVHPTNGYGAFSMWALAKAIAENDWTTQDAQASSGSAYFPDHLALLKSIDFSKVDIAIIHYGSNDITAGNGVPIDNASDPDDYTTLCGAFRYSVEKLLTAYPHLQIFVSLPCYRYWPDTGKYPDTYTNNLGKYCYEYVDALRNAAAEYNLPVIDCFYGLGVNKLNVATMTSDGAHHSQIGRQLLGEFIAGHLNGRQSSGKNGKGEGGKGIIYIEGDSTTTGTWTGTTNEITKYYDGLVIAYKINIAGVSGGTTLNINGLGAVPVKRNASTAVTTTYPVGAVVILTYSGGAWLTADYDANTKNSAGTSNKTGSKMYLVGATSQTSSGTTTYTNTNAYIGTDNCLYSGGAKVYTANDLTAITNAVIAALPVYDGEVV